MKNKERIPVTLVQGVVKGHPQFNRKEIVDKILERTKDSSKLIKLSELASLTDIQLYQLYLNN